MSMNNDNKQMYELCKKHMHSYVLAEMTDGTSVDGIITGLDDEYVYLAVPNDSNTQESQHMNDGGHDYRQFGYGYPGYGYGFGGPGYGYGYGFGRPRFRRLILPLAALTALTLLPWY